MKNYIAIILFLALFLIESLIGKTFYQPTDFTCEELAANQMAYEKAHDNYNITQRLRI